MIAPPPSLQTSRLAMRKPTASRSRQPVITPMVATPLMANNEKAHRVSSETAGHHSSMAFNYSDEYVSCTYLRNPDLQVCFPGYTNSTKLARLFVLIYGLKQSAGEWYECLSTVLQQIGFISSEFDPCVLVRTANSTFVSTNERLGYIRSHFPFH